ncbi:hypothetical protein H5202_19060 [Shewanella sp. SG41-4]|uniref:hypothetical protein n=1 Tax=Shewanella sp. SG41-4 TaxID=2760976 RepID=UPI0015FF94B8|nr:hypothetical protein [Shewanella sp. SG41-4]MBB1440725.1 hypothetical protein [Shewanella sp. SG41-4]
MKMFVDVPTVYLCADVVDFRKSINGLAAFDGYVGCGNTSKGPWHSIARKPQE